MAAATAKRTKNDYIFEHPQSKYLYLRLRDSDGRRFVKSLGTTDKLQAEILALPLIAEHKARLLAARPHVETTWWHKLEPGRKHTAPDGGEIIATDKELLYIGHNGAITRTEPNGGPLYRLAGGPLSLPTLAEAYGAKRPTVPVKDGDDGVIETYLKHKNITGHFEHEARSVWALYKTLTESKPLKDATRDDGRKLVAHFEGKGLKSATVQKKVGWLNAAVNLAIKEGRLKFNPFSSIVPDRKDKAKRLPLDEADMKACKRNLETLSETDQLLFRLLGATGMRLSEAFEIDGEMKERGVRYVIVGKKTEQSLRRVPLPAAVLPFLPKTIKGPLFPMTTADPPDAASKRFARFLDDCGIVDPRKVTHSLRHRAQDRLRAAGCPEDVRWAILGHEEETVAAGYGEGFPVRLLKKWIDKIGC
jgi:integrase